MKRESTNLAKRLRKNQTLHETIVWALLRSRRFENFKFVRQYPIGKYVVDFCCRSKKLIIELDGGQHCQDRQIQHDQARGRYLKERGYTTLRIPNSEVDKNLDGVYDAIYHELIENRS